MLQQNDQSTLRRNLRRAGIGALCLAAAIVALGAYTRLVEASDLKTWTREAEIPTVSLISPTVDSKVQALVLPGTLQAYYDARIYSRVPGYVQAWYKDIGARVKKGDALASIETPELDQQIMQANADLNAAEAAERLSDATAKRWESLLPLDAVSKQDVEEKDGDLATKTGAVKAARADLDRLQAMKAFARITAPFDGVITKRNIDIGALVSAGPSSSGDPLFAVSDIHALRLYVNVPQSYSAQIVPNMTASLTVPEYPGRIFAAKLVSTANAINAGSSTLLVEFEADNRDGLLKPGDFAQVSMNAPSTSPVMRLPAEALTFRSAGLEVATVDRNDRVVMRRVSIATDLGTQVVVASGVTPADRIVDNPPDSLTNGDKVRIDNDAE
jgi:RND family efflux transporter MFP subunit